MILSTAELLLSRCIAYVCANTVGLPLHPLLVVLYQHRTALVHQSHLLVVANDDDGQFVVEGEPRELVAFARHDRLDADRLVLVDVEVEDVNLAVNRDCREHRAGVRRPLDITHRTAQVKHKQRLAGTTCMQILSSKDSASCLTKL